MTKIQGQDLMTMSFSNDGPRNHDKKKKKIKLKIENCMKNHMGKPKNKVKNWDYGTVAIIVELWIKSYI